MFSESWFPNLVAHLFLQPECGDLENLQGALYCGPKSLGKAAICMGDVLASAKLQYGSPWVSALQIPRPTNDVCVFYTPIQSGLAYSFYGFPINRDASKGRCAGEPRIHVGKSSYGGITSDCWHAFASNVEIPANRIFGGEFFTVESCLQFGLALVGKGKKSPS